MSEIEINRTFGFAEMVTRLRSVTLLKNVVPGFRPYRRSEITFKQVDLNQIYPAALYVLETVLERTRQTRNVLLPFGIDTLNLTPEVAMIEFTHDRDSILLSLPIVEESEDDGGSAVLTDGLHRAIVARHEGMELMSVAYIRSIAAPLQPMPVSWNEVRVVTQIPPGSQKKKLRFGTPGEIKEWIATNNERFLQGFDDIDKLGWMHTQI